MKKTTPISRRDFLKLSTNALFGLSGLLGLGGLMRYLSYTSAPEKPTEFDLGDVANYPVGSRTLRNDIPAIIYNRDGKIMAYSLVCTHLGCTVAENGAEFECPCHGSRFDSNGAVLAGPAQNPLKNLRVEILEDNTLRLHTRG
jgi:cytochrome b6-f complex iron-sulfur subunit